MSRVLYVIEQRPKRSNDAQVTRGWHATDLPPYRTLAAARARISVGFSNPYWDFRIVRFNRASNAGSGEG